MPIGVIYGEQSGIVRRIILPDNGVQELQQHVGPGEALLVLPDGVPADLYSATAAVAEATGKTIPLARCAVVDARDNVVALICADPLLDMLDGHDLVTCPHDYIAVGDKYDRAQASFIKVTYRFAAEPAPTMRIR